MNTENLLAPRYKVIADYPRSKFTVGDPLEKYVFKTSELGVYTYVTNIEIPLQGANEKPEYVESMPHIFKPLSWWEDRNPDDMPEYVKKNNGEVYKIKEWDGTSNPYVLVDTKYHTGYVSGCTETPIYLPYLPSTIEEYTSFINNQTK